MANNVNITVARSALSRIKAQGLKGAKADKAGLDFVCGALAYAMATHGDESNEAAGLSMVAMNVATRGAAYLVEMVAKADAAAAAAVATVEQAAA